jgi:prepilin-type N-terminal cleavage/methylation domain-containing protein
MWSTERLLRRESRLPRPLRQWSATESIIFDMRLHRYVRIYGKKVAFTLVELLVVTAIVGVLMALLFPLAKSLTGKADTAACAANLRKIGAGHGAYIRRQCGDAHPCRDAMRRGAHLVSTS